jgi:hypothetical protein
MTVEQTAHYLGYTSPAALKNLPIKPIRLIEVGAGCSPKYDRRAIDLWLDGLSGLAEAPTPSANSPMDDAETELAAWKAKRASRAS